MIREYIPAPTVVGTALVLCRAGLEGQLAWIVIAMGGTSQEAAGTALYDPADPEAGTRALLAALDEANGRHPGSPLYAATTALAAHVATTTGLQLEPAGIPESYFAREVRTAITDAVARHVPPTRHIVLVADASRRADGTAAAAWLVADTSTGRVTTGSQMVTGTSSTDVELKAIRLGLRKIPVAPHTELHIVSDSRNALEVIADAGHDGVHTYWVPGHTGHPANETVDALARGLTLAAGATPELRARAQKAARVGARDAAALLAGKAHTEIIGTAVSWPPASGHHGLRVVGGQAA